ncbi:MAG: hypothetical protein A3F72_01015 [Bacteroidetes bacterium RIFCSPLOWO2_12_FULL_35_15]|nr:MAG: hypothetical protein A3F72_01015 [Bacteroidetes bacterium RIFCSPLOWO2_12_FULL_35_15]
MTPLKSAFHFKGLDGLRCIGTFIVLFHHIELGKNVFDIPSISKYYMETGTGQAFMTMFFVLSGFLIFYLLINERKKTGIVEVKKFYRKRISRIWPVYYILVLTVIFLFSNNNWFSSPTPSVHAGDYYNVVSLYLFHLPNFRIFFTSSFVLLIHLWSLGAEEQFYALSPWLIKKSTNYLKTFIFIIVLKVSIKLMVALAYRTLPISSESIMFLKHLETFLFKFPIEAFAIGGIIAYLFIEKKENVLNYLYKPYIQWVNLLLMLAIVPLSHRSESLQLLVAINFAIIIINLTGNTKPLFMLDNKYSNYIGQISYGIYMYQIPLVYLILNIFKPYYSADHMVLWNILYYSTCTLLSMVTAIISYELIERKFINWARS